MQLCCDQATSPAGGLFLLSGTERGRALSLTRRGTSRKEGRVAVTQRVGNHAGPLPVAQTEGS